MVIALGVTRNLYEHLYPLVAAINHYNSPRKIYIFIEDDALNLPFDNIEYINMNKVALDKEGANYKTGYSIACLVKLYMASLFPEEDKILWLDTDLIVRDSLEELWNTDISDYYMAGVVDAGIKVFHTPWLQCDWDQYLNAGVLLLNLAKIRQDDKEKELIEMINGKKMACPEQDCLNYVFENHKLIIDDKWNAARYTTGKNHPNPIIYHWAGGKPNWVYDREHSEWWLEAEALTDRTFKLEIKGGN